MRVRYDRIHESSRSAVLNGTYRDDTVPTDADPRWGLSLVALPPADLAERLAGLAADLAARATNPHVPYEAANVHVTVRSLEGYASVIPPAVVATYADRVGRLLTGLDELTIAFGGTAVASTGVIARGFPNHTLRELRDRLRRDAAEHPPLLYPSGDAGRVRDTAHASLLVFRAGFGPDPDLVRAVEAARHEFGAFTTRRLALVSYRVRVDAVRLVRLADLAW